MDLQQIGYFLYMEEQEKKQQEQLKVNADLNADLVGTEATTNEEADIKNYLSRNIRPY